MGRVRDASGGTRIEELASYLVEHASEAEAMGRLPDDTAKRMKEVEIARLLQPTALGGYEADPRDLIQGVMPPSSDCRRRCVGSDPMNGRATTVFLDRLATLERDELLSLGRARRYRPPSILFFEGDDAHDVLVVRAGDVKVSITLEAREVLLDVLGAGEVLGELSAIDGGRRSATATALTTVEVVAIPSDAFMEFLDFHPRVGLDLMRSLAGRLRNASRRQVEYGALDSVGRVCRRLVELVDRYGTATADGLVITTPLSQSEIAGWAGLSREAVVKGLHTLRALGWLVTSARSITVVDLDAVRARASIALD
jgi:CRP-like cAMP-binding protein